VKLTGADNPAREYTAFSPLLVGVLSETKFLVFSVCCRRYLSVPYWSGCSVKRPGGAPQLITALTLSVPYWSGCSVKPACRSRSPTRPTPFSPLLVGVLSETPKDKRQAADGLIPFSPLLVGVLSETRGAARQTGWILNFQSPTGRGAQ